MKKLFTLNWGKPSKEATPIEQAEPLEEVSINRVNSYSQDVLTALQTIAPEAGYNGNSVQRLAEDLTANRTHYSADQRVKIANMYGAFLGRAIIATYPEFAGTWVSWRGDIGIQLAISGRGSYKILFPITKAFKHIDNGQPDSIYSLFAAVPEFALSNPTA